MSNWREDLIEAVKSDAERKAEAEARRKKRIEEALEVAREALGLGGDCVDFAAEQLREKGQDVNVDTKDDGRTLSFRDYSVVLGLDVETAVLTVVYNDGRPKEFDFAKDRHLAPKDVEEYVGRRVVEMARAAQKAEPW